MPANCFYIDSDLQENSVILLEGAEHHHLAHVMRIDENEEIELVNGRGVSARGKVRAITKKNASISVLFTTLHSAPSPRISLAIPLMRPSKLEWVMEKSTELGIDAFFLYSADHSEKTTLSSHQLERLKGLSIAALKQSGRFFLPSFELVVNLDSLLQRTRSSSSNTVCLFGDAKPSVRIDLANLQETRKILFITGPEKGFSQDELSSLAKYAEGVNLSIHVLRAETAPIAAASILGLLMHPPPRIR